MIFRAEVAQPAGPGSTAEGAAEVGALAFVVVADVAGATELVVGLLESVAESVADPLLADVTVSELACGGVAFVQPAARAIGSSVRTSAVRGVMVIS